MTKRLQDNDTESSKRARTCSPEKCEPTEQLAHQREPVKLLGFLAGRAGVPGWEYPFKDEARRSFLGRLRCPVERAVTEAWFTRIRDGTPWTRPDGPHGPIPRQTSWMVQPPCICHYKYGGFQAEADSYPPWMIELMQLYMPMCGFRDQKEWPNCCNLNLYDDGGQSVGWHSDDEDLFQGLVQDCRIISLSLGESRRFQLRPSTLVGREDDGSTFTLVLENGELCTMEGEMQRHYEHSVPKSGGVSGPRINLTWRWIVHHHQKCRDPKVATTRMDFSRLEVASSSRVVPVPQDMLRQFMTATVEKAFAEASGASVSWDEGGSKALIAGPADVIERAEKLLVRVLTHCHWGCSEAKVVRLLAPRRLQSARCRLSPMSVLPAGDKLLTVADPMLRIGKDSACDIVVADPLVSRQHLALQLDEDRGAVCVIDCSTNGTFLNGKALPARKSGKIILSHGDELLLRDPAGGAGDAEFGWMVNIAEG